MNVIPQTIETAEHLGQEDQHRSCLKCNLGMWLSAQVTEHNARRAAPTCVRPAARRKW